MTSLCDKCEFRSFKVLGAWEKGKPLNIIDDRCDLRERCFSKGYPKRKFRCQDFLSMYEFE